VDASSNLEEVERRAYQSSYSDGIIDIFVGVSLLVIGAIWIWAEDYGAFAGMLPAVLAPSLLPLRKRVVEARGGYVRWSERRRRSERRNLWGAVAAGVAVLLLSGAAYFVAAGSGGSRDVLADFGPGLLAFILALLSFIIGMLIEQGRFFGYAAVLAAGGVLAVIADSNPGWPMLGGGVVVSIVGLVMLARYLRDNPVADS
jgi:hypothetical protein